MSMEQGFLGRDFPDKSSGRFRIAVTGDSFVSGTLTMPYYTAFVEVLQKMLTVRGIGWKSSIAVWMAAPGTMIFLR